jgi:WD40 repeat protein
VASLKGHQGGIYTATFRPNGEQLAAAGFDGTVRIYDLKSGQVAKAFVPVPIEGSVVSMLK